MQLSANPPSTNPVYQDACILLLRVLRKSQSKTLLAQRLQGSQCAPLNSGLQLKPGLDMRHLCSSRRSIATLLL